MSFQVRFAPPFAAYARTLTLWLAGVPHCAFYNPYKGENELPRQSIEARALVFYDQLSPLDIAPGLELQTPCHPSASI